jgi:hypothetical protein
MRRPGRAAWGASRAFAQPDEAVGADVSYFNPFVRELDQRHPDLCRVYVGWVYGEPIEALAEDLGKPVNTITSYQTRARRFILERVAEDLEARYGISRQDMLSPPLLPKHRAIREVIARAWSAETRGPLAPLSRRVEEIAHALQFLPL